jgi:hypothetical protein
MLAKPLFSLRVQYPAACFGEVHCRKLKWKGKGPDIKSEFGGRIKVG